MSPMKRLWLLNLTLVLNVISIGGCGEEPQSEDAPQAEQRPEAAPDMTPMLSDQGSASGGDMLSAADDPLAGETLTVGEALGRPAKLFFPNSYQRGQRWPLIVLLHGYGANGALQDAIFGLRPRQNERGYLLLVPEGREDARGNQFWAATEACCDFAAEGDPDEDVDYLTALLEETLRSAEIDPERVSLVGHSNGGYMSYRMACERPALLQRFVVLAGSDKGLDMRCPPSVPLSLLHIHGTADPTVSYRSGGISSGAEESAQRWGEGIGCEPTPIDVKRVDLLPSLEGAETDLVRWLGCPRGAEVELWSVRGGDHLFIGNSPAFKDKIVDFLLGETEDG